MKMATRRICGMSYSNSKYRLLNNIKPGETIEPFNSRKLYNENDCKYCGCKNTIKNNECVRCGAPDKLQKRLK